MTSRTLAKSRNEQQLFGWLFVTPFILVFLAFQIYPIVYSFLLSFHTYSGYTNMNFAGLRNFRRLFQDPVFHLAIFYTFYIWIICFVFQLFFAFLFAAIFCYSRIKAKAIWRSIFYFPNLISAAALSLIFYNLFVRTGSVNMLLEQFGYSGEAINWLGQPWIARGIVSLMIWLQYFGVFILYISSAILAVPISLFESASIDGCKPFKSFTLIVLPQLRPIIFYILVTSLVGGLQTFEHPYLLTRGTGSPANSLTTMVLYLYRVAFTSNQLGYGASVGISLFILVLLGTKGLNMLNKWFEQKYI